GEVEKAGWLRRDPLLEILLRADRCRDALLVEGDDAGRMEQSAEAAHLVLEPLRCGHGLAVACDRGDGGAGVAVDEGLEDEDLARQLRIDAAVVDAALLHHGQAEGEDALLAVDGPLVAAPMRIRVAVAAEMRRDFLEAAGIEDRCVAGVEL